MIDYFDKQHWLASAQAKATQRARLKMVTQWFRHVDIEASDRIFDVGATPEVERPDANCMLTWFLEKTRNLTLYSPEDIAHLVDLFPGVHIRPPGKDVAAWPADDLEFDYVTSSAVIEHVGDAASQVAFIREAGRVAKKGIFITTPNRWHPLELHTKLLFFHWLPKPIHRTILRWLGRPDWALEQNLNLLTKRELVRYAHLALGDRFNISIAHVRFFGMKSNLLLIANRSPDATNA